ncbi:MAG TPA: VWA-like domain-containing protein [Actinomycetota bacterium]|nr:VWA-like domain-containing protein [Actinomycetota bacterium]
MTTSHSLDGHKVAAARLWAANRFPYLATGLFACSVIGVPELGGMATDESWRLYVDPEVVDSLDAEQVGSLLVHHVGHLLRDHAGRASAMGVERSNADDWAMAADAEINDDLHGSDLRMPGQVVLPGDLGAEEGKLAEEYFQLVRKKRKDGDQSLPGCDCGSGADSVARDFELSWGGGAPIVSKGSSELLRCQMASEMLRHAGQQPGSVPAGLLRWAQDLLQPKVDWRKALAAELRRGVAAVAGCVDYSYSRPSRRQSVMRDVILPSMRKPVPEVAVVCDTSGSMSEAMLGQAMAEVEGLLRTVGLGANKLRVLSCDYDVHKVQRVTTARQVQLAGGGGTDMGRGIDAAMKLKPAPSVVVVLTDGFTPWPDQGPKDARVVVALIGGDRSGKWVPPSWARVVHVDDVA